MPDRIPRRHIKRVWEHLDLLPRIEQEISRIESTEREDALRRAYLIAERNRIRIILLQMRCPEAQLHFEEGQSLYQIAVRYRKTARTIKDRIDNAIIGYLKQIAADNDGSAANGLFTIK